MAWGHVDGNRPQGVIAAGLESGELALWDPAKILAGAGYVIILIDVTSSNFGPFHSTSQSLIFRNTTHTGPVRGLDFNPIQTNLLASGGINGEVRADIVSLKTTLIFSIGLHLGLEGP